jgi:D-alanyl-D-alanine carboxypeptidase (penicillin-binding protein 5/6)
MSINLRIHRPGRRSLRLTVVAFTAVGAILAAALLPTLAAALLPTLAGASAAGGPAATGARPGSARGALATPTPAASAATGPAAIPPAAGLQVGTVAAVAAPRVAAEAAILADEATGQVLFERNVDEPRAMASTTKVMTALLTLERLDERRVVVIGARPPRIGEESLGLRQGERLTVLDLLLGLMLKSANDAGVALAEAVDGSEAAFVRRMNAKAAALRLGDTRYVTPYGLDRPGHRTSARDLARLWEVAMRRADFRAVVATRSARLPGGPLSLRRFVTTNQLLGPYRWTVGGKTGFTSQAGRCLVASASRGGRRLVAVALGSPNAFDDVRALFEYGFSKFVRVRLAARGQPVSAGPGRPPDLQVGADADALIRLDLLGRVRLSLARQPAGGSAPGRAWLTAGPRRLAPVPLVDLPAGAAPPATSTGGATTSPPAGPAGAPGTSGAPVGTTGGPAGALLVAGAPVPVGPVPPGAPAPTIDPSLRR